jgi:hypothetical protein
MIHIFFSSYIQRWRWWWQVSGGSRIERRAKTQNLLLREKKTILWIVFTSDKKYKNKIFFCLTVWKFSSSFLLFCKWDLFWGPFSFIPLIAMQWVCVCVFVHGYQLRVACCCAARKKMNVQEIDVVVVALMAISWSGVEGAKNPPGGC